MIGTQDLHEIISTVVFSGRVKGERPLSLLIIAQVGSGKSELLSSFNEKYTDTILYCTDITPFALHKKHGRQLKSGRIRHIIMTDLLVALNKSKEQSDALITFISDLVEEGVARVESQKSHFVVDTPVRCGFITSLASDELRRKKNKWASVGFLSRMLPVSYSYDQVTISRIFDSITNRDYLGDIPNKVNLPKEDVHIYIPKHFSDGLIWYAIETKDSKDAYGFRRLKQLQTYLMGHALMCDRDEVTQEDWDHLESVVHFFNTSCDARI